MKKLIFILLSLFIYNMTTAQSLHVVPYYNWSSKVTFMTSPSPLITGYGSHSDSLSRAFDGGTFYEYAGEYYRIESWADYYYWYTQKYWYQFNDPSLYEYYYLANDDFGMAQYICGNTYTGWMYPSRIAVSFPGRNVYVNNLSRRNIKRCIKNDSWENANYLARTEPTLKDDKIRRNTILTKDNKIKVVDKEKLQSNKRDAKIVKYNNSRSTISKTNNLANKQIDRTTIIDNPKRGNSTGNNTWRTTNIKNSNKSTNKTSSFNNTRSTNISRNTSTKTNISNTKRSTNNKQARSSGTVKSK